MIIAAAAAPTILVAKTDKIHWGRPLVSRKYKLKARWSAELAQDLAAFHGINADAELNALFIHEAEKEIALKFPNARVLSIDKSPYVIDPQSFTPYCTAIATLA